MEKKKILVTAALPYINNVPHLGHIVGSHLPADIFARYCRLKGHDTLFVGGSDENGTTSEIAAKENNLQVREFCNILHKIHKRVYDWFNISYDIFSRTSKKTHYKNVQEFFSEIDKNGFIEEDTLEIFYCETCKTYLADRYVKGTCPKCGYENANGDQCEKCTAVFESKELINPKCTICGNTPILKESKHLFLRLDKLENQLSDWINSNKQWRPQVTNLALGWIKQGLKPRCITRDLKWGVPVNKKGYEDKVFYVWFDAPLGYLSFTKEISEDWEKYWNHGEVYHWIGKDNIPFHTIFWPGMILANKTIKLPHQICGLQYLNYEGGKFSKSKKHGVFCEKLINSNLNPDSLRAYLTYIIPENSDTEFKWSDFQDRINNDIIGNFANLINRSLTLSYKNFKTLEGSIDPELKSQIQEKINIVDQLLEKCELRNAFLEILSLAKLGNQYFDKKEPWKLVKEGKGKDVLYNCAYLSSVLAILISPYLPETSKKIYKMLSLKEIKWEDLEPKEKYKLKQPEILFSKISDEELEQLKARLTEGIDLKSLLSNEI